jgi:hypothetical protein
LSYGAHVDSIPAAEAVDNPLPHTTFRSVVLDQEEVFATLDALEAQEHGRHCAFLTNVSYLGVDES